MKKVTIKIFIDGEEVEHVDQKQQTAESHLNEDQRAAGHEAIEKIEHLLMEHGKWTTKPIPPVKLMTVQHCIERLLAS